MTNTTTKTLRIPKIDGGNSIKEIKATMASIIVNQYEEYINKVKSTYLLT